MVKRMAGPERMSASALSRETGVPQSTLSRWLHAASTVAGMGADHSDDRKRTPKSSRRWTTEEKLRVVVEAATLSDAELGEFLRRQGLHEATLEEWRRLAEAALSPGKVKRPGQSAEAKKIRSLEKELRRKEKALAELAALLALKKKADAIWGDEDDDTLSKSEGERSN